MEDIKVTPPECLVARLLMQNRVCYMYLLYYLQFSSKHIILANNLSHGCGFKMFFSFVFRKKGFFLIAGSWKHHWEEWWICTTISRGGMQIPSLYCLEEHSLLLL